MRWVNTKSQSVITTLFYLLFGLILAAFFIFAVMTKVRDAVDDSTYHKRFFAMDLALLVDSLHANNGNFTIDYEYALPDKIKLDADLIPDKVILTDSSDAALENRPQTSFVFGYNEYLGIIPSHVNMSSNIFLISATQKNITFVLTGEP